MFGDTVFMVVAVHRADPGSASSIELDGKSNSIEKIGGIVFFRVVVSCFTSGGLRT
jgi:hypothetical protein